MTTTTWCLLALALGAILGTAYGAAVVRSGQKTPARTDEEWNALCIQRQGEAYHLGVEQGVALGEQRGSSRLAEQIALTIRERDGYGEVTQEDLERARRGLLH